MIIWKGPANLYNLCKRRAHPDDRLQKADGDVDNDIYDNDHDNDNNKNHNNDNDNNQGVGR